MASATKEATVGHKPGRERLTDKRLEKLTAPDGKRVEIADTLVWELRVRVGKSGKKSWSILYRVAGPDGTRGKMQRLGLGVYPQVSLTDAREKAREALEMADKGIDPAAERAVEIEQRETRTFEAVLERYVELHVKRNTKDGRWAKEQEDLARKEAEAKGGEPREVGRCPAERLLADHVKPKWEGRLLETIRRDEVNTLLDEIVVEQGAPIAREVRKHLAGMFNWAADRGLIAVSPVAGLRRKDLRYTARKRVLSMEELGRVWDAAGKAAYPFGDMVRLIILTGQRRSEIAGLESGWIDKKERTVEIPAGSYKTGVEHVFPLSPPAWALVEGLPRWNEGEFMFSTKHRNRPGGVRPISGFSKAKIALDKEIAEKAAKGDLPPMEPWTLHDIRRSVATHMARLGIPQEHIERVLGHIVAGVAGTYNRYSYLEEKRAALEKWGKLWS